MSVRIRMKKIGRSHQPFFRICAIDKRSPRHGRVLEELGTYNPLVKETDARALLKPERIDYWISVGAQPSERVAVLIKKYGTNGTHLEAQKAALERLAAPKVVPDPGEPASLSKPKAGKGAPSENGSGAGEQPEPVAAAAGVETSEGSNGSE